MSRQRIGLRPPRPGDVEAIPTVSRRRALWRACHRRHAQPWWFPNRDDNPRAGRFDLHTRRGTAYWAVSATAAIIEAIADPDQVDPPVLSVEAITNLVVWKAEHVPAARAKRLADTTVASVTRLTAELGTTVPYDLCWQWADAIEAAGRNGIVYRGRFSLEESIALFGHAGTPGTPPHATAAPAALHYHELPPAFRDGISSVGRLDHLEPAPPP